MRKSKQVKNAASGRIGLGTLAAFNPLTGIIECYRALGFPSQFAGWNFLLASAVISVLTLVAGLYIFNRLEPAVLKEI